MADQTRHGRPNQTQRQRPWQTKPGPETEIVAAHNLRGEGSGVRDYPGKGFPFQAKVPNFSDIIHV